ncbi:MAG TPA: efflux RND transporter periplasmic adaptor subunit [Urbifossiella sp.]|nr:efflux RND transporter periplasmic adaptor subunit [Urbifossiella sp.]
MTPTDSPRGTDRVNSDVPGSTPADAAGPVETHGPRGHAHPAHRVSGLTRRRLVTVLLVTIGLGGALAGGAVLTGFLPNPVVAGDPKASGHGDRPAAGPRSVKVVRPKRDPSFRITTQQFATVEPYYLAGLRTRVSGEVRYVAKNIGEPVRAGEVLVEIDVPDLRQAVELKAAVIAQREREVTAAEADLKVARSAVEAAKVAVRQKQVDVTRAQDVRAARKTDFDQVAELFARNSVVKARVDSVELDFHAAERAVEAAEADVERVKVDVTGKAASVEKAAADVELKQSLVDVARKERDAAAIQLGYTRLRAPFDGVIVARTADPGKYVSGGSEPLMTVARTDLVTVVMKLPDNSAPYVSAGTQALVEFTQLPGVTARGAVTRFSPYIDPVDRTMRVEVDVFNGSSAESRVNRTKAAVAHGLAPLVPFDRLAGLAAGGSLPREAGWLPGDALVPDWGPDGRYTRLVPGMTATVRLDLENFADAFLLPSGAVFGRAGQSYILVVEDGVTKGVPVAVQVNDGKLVKVAAVTPAGGRQVTRELTGREVVVAARQLEVGEGTRVNPVFESW